MQKKIDYSVEAIKHNSTSVNSVCGQIGKPWQMVSGEILSLKQDGCTADDDGSTRNEKDWHRLVQWDNPYASFLHQPLAFVSDHWENNVSSKCVSIISHSCIPTCTHTQTDHFKTVSKLCIIMVCIPFFICQIISCSFECTHSCLLKRSHSVLVSTNILLS